MNLQLRSELVELRYAKRYAELLEVVKPLAAANDTAATAMLAQLWEITGQTRHHADSVIDDLHRTISKEDVAAHLELSKAYEQGLGALKFEVRARRSFSHLLAAAKADAGPSYSLSVARAFRTGNLGVNKSATKAEWWYRKAIAQGWTEVEDELNDLQREED
jgi:TPR repeat protein